jgi:hypothetical protein
MVEKTCKRCSKVIRGRRDKIYCSDRCRFADWAEYRTTLPEAKPCRYCGLACDTIDHIPPQSVRPRLVELGIANRYPFIEVWCCRECNTLLGARALWTVETRKKFIKQALRKRYHRYLNAPEWTDREISHLSGTLQRYVLNREIIKAMVEKRLTW